MTKSHTSAADISPTSGPPFSGNPQSGQRRGRYGPGALVAAAFIGPGTVTACTVAGAEFGYALIWALVFATAATIALQDMAARLGVGARLGLGEALARGDRSPTVRWSASLLILLSLGVGNAAYEAGNIAGASLGLAAIIGNGAGDRRILLLAIAGVAGVALLHGRYETLEKVLIGLVVLMAAAFAASAILVRPDFAALAAGFAPTMPPGGAATAIALIGTTIVPYNLFLHAAAARRKWTSADDMREARIDGAVSIGLGGLVSAMILSTAATTLFGTGAAVATGADMARAIEPTFGPLARYVVGVGLLAAGLTSAITAPMATGYVVSELFGPRRDGDVRMDSALFRAAALATIAVGATIALLDLSPVSLILVAQYANGLLLPIVAAFLLVVMNDRKRLGRWVNGPVANLAGAGVVAVAIFLGVRSIMRAMGAAP